MTPRTTPRLGNQHPNWTSCLAWPSQVRVRSARGGQSRRAAGTRAISKRLGAAETSLDEQTVAYHRGQLAAVGMLTRAGLSGAV